MSGERGVDEAICTQDRGRGSGEEDWGACLPLAMARGEESKENT